MDASENSPIFTDLSHELLCSILEYLPLRKILSMGMLCKKLLSAVDMHLRLCKSIDFCQDKIHGYMPSSITDDHMHTLLKKCPQLETVYGLHPVKVERRRLRKRSALTVPGIIEALSLCLHLKAIETSDLRLFEAVMQLLPQLEIIGHFQNRDGVFPPQASQRLKLHPYPRISSLHLIGVEVPELTAMPHLQHLHLQCVRFTKLQPFRAFLAHNLRSFVMKHCMGPSASLRYLSLIIALSSSPNLSHLELVRVPLPGGLFQRAVEDSHRHNGFINLKTLVVSGCKFVLEADLGHLMIVSSKNLETLYIQPSLTKDSLFVSLSFAQCTFPSLRNLHLGYMDILNSSGEWSNDALVSLGLAEVPDTPSSLTDSGMKVINKLFRGLKSLSVSNCPHLMSMCDWQPLGGMESWPQLTDLTLQRCHCLQLSSFSLIIPVLYSLQVLILKDMFREPPKGCSHVGLSAGTGLGMSSAVVSNQDEHIAVQGHHQDFDHPGEEDNEENEREFIDVENDDNQEPHFMVLQGDFFDAEDDDVEIHLGDERSFNHQQEFDTDFDDDSLSLDSLSDDLNDQKVSSKKSKKKSTSHLRRSKRTLRSSKSNVRSEHTAECSRSANADPMNLEESSFESDELFDDNEKSVKSKRKSNKNIRGYDPHQPSTSKAGRHLDYSFSSDTNSSDSEIYKNSKLNGSKKREKKLQLSKEHSKKSKIKKSPSWSDSGTCSCSGFDTDDDCVVGKKRIKVEDSLLDEHSQLTKPCCVRVTRLEDDISLSDQVSKRSSEISNETVAETCNCMLNECSNELPSTSKVHKCICSDKKSKHNLVAPEEIASHQHINLTNDEKVRCNTSDNELLINNVQRNICINNEINSSLTGKDLLKSMSCYVRITKVDNKAISTSKSHVKNLELTGNISERNQLESPKNIVCSNSVSSIKLENSFDDKRHERIEQSTKQINSRQDCPLVSDYSKCFKADTSSVSVGVCGNISKNDGCFDDANKSVEATSEINKILTPTDEFQSFASTSSAFVSKNNGEVSVNNSEIPEDAESCIMMPELKDGSSMNKSVHKNECGVKSVSNNNNDCDQIIDVSEILTENVSSNSNEKLLSDPFHCSVNLKEVKNETDACSSQISRSLNSKFIKENESIHCDPLVKLENKAESICSVSKDICQTSETIADVSFVNAEAFSEISHDAPSTSGSKNCKQAPPCTLKDVEVSVTSPHSTKTIENKKLKKFKSQNVYLKQSEPVIINSSVDKKQISKITPCHVLIPKLEDDILSDSKEYELVRLENSFLCNPCQPSTSKNIIDSSNLSRQSANTSHPLGDKSCHALIKQEVMSPNHNSNDSTKPLNILPSSSASNSADNNLSCQSGKCSVVIKRIEDNGLYIDLESEKLKINCDTTKPSMFYNSEMNAGSYSCVPSTSKIENSAAISDHDSKSSHPPLKKLKKSANDYSNSNYYIQISDDLQGSIEIVNSVTGESHKSASCSVRVSKLSSKDCNKPMDFSKNKSVNKCNISERSCENCKSHLIYDPSLPSTSKANFDMDLCQSSGTADNYLHGECSSSDKKSCKKSPIKNMKRNQKSKKNCCNAKNENIDTANCKSGNSFVSKNSFGNCENSSNMSETVKSIKRLKIKNSDAAIILKKQNSPEKGFDSDIKPTSYRIKCESDDASNISSDNLSQFRYRRSPCLTTWEMSTENESTSAAIISVLSLEGKRKKKQKVFVCQSTQASTSDIRRSVRGIPRIALRARRPSLNLGKRKKKTRPERISDRAYIRKLHTIHPRPECWDKSTSTSDPLLEDDAIQTLQLMSNTLLSITVVSCGVSDIVIGPSPMLFHVEVQACRILKRIEIENCLSMKRLNISQCPKYNICALAFTVFTMETDSYCLVSYEPCMQSYHPGYGEKAILSKTALNQSILLCHDVLDISDESIQANFREKIWGWLHYLSRLHGTLNYTREKSKRKSGCRRSRISDYPWSHDLRRKHGQYIYSPTTEFCETEGQYQLLTNNPIFCEAFETHKLDKEIPSVDDCEACKDNSLLSYEAVEKYCQMQKKFIGIYIPITENNRINTYKHIQPAS